MWWAGIRDVRVRVPVFADIRILLAIFVTGEFTGNYQFKFHVHLVFFVGACDGIIVKHGFLVYVVSSRNIKNRFLFSDLYIRFLYKYSIYNSFYNIIFGYYSSLVIE